MSVRRMQSEWVSNVSASHSICRRWWLPLVCFVIGYVAMAELSRLLSFSDHFAPLWLPAGLAVATFAFSSPRRWPTWAAAVVVASIIYNTILHAKPWGVMFGFTVSNLLCAVLSAWLIQKSLPGRFRLTQVRDVLWFLGSSCVVGPAFSSVIGSLTLWAAFGTDVRVTYPSWFSGNLVGVLVMAPMTLLLMQRFSQLQRACQCGAPNDRASWSLYALLISWLLVFAIVVFHFSSLPIAYLVVPFIVGLILRFEVFGTTTGMIVVALVMFASHSKGLGRIAIGESLAVQLLIAQGFLATLGTMGLILASVVHSQRRMVSRLVTTQRNLASLHQETQRIFDAVPSIVLYKDAQMRILRTNRSAVQWLGLAASQIEGRTLSELRPGLRPLPGEDEKALGCQCSQLGVEQRLSSPEGHTQWLLTDRVVIADPIGKPRQVVTVMTDITDRKKVEAELERSNQDLERYAVVVSHDLKEPLRAVSGYCRFLQEDYGDVLDERGRSYVEKAIKGADRMTGMIGDLLEYSRVSQTNLKLVPVELDGVVANVLGLFHQAIEDSKAVVRIEPLPIVLGSEASLTQLFQNLISNALKFVPHGRTPVVTMSCQYDDERPVITVADNGIGVDVNQQKRIFEIFQRLHRQDEYPGSGVGLAICERIMIHHHGKILVESEAGHGAKFRLVFPPVSTISSVLPNYSYCETKL